MKNKKIYIIILLFIILAIIFISVILLNSQKGQKQERIQEESTYSLDEEELKAIETFLDDEQNNSFLYCEYQKPSEIDITELLSQGAGLNKEITEVQQKEYNDKIMEKRGMYPQSSLLVAIKKYDVEDMFEEKTGEKLTDIETKLEDWIFIENGKLYAKSFAGNRYSKVDCRMGKKEGENYIVYTRLDDSPISKYVKVTLKKQGDTYLFVANEFVKE